MGSSSTPCWWKARSAHSNWGMGVRGMGWVFLLVVDSTIMLSVVEFHLARAKIGTPHPKKKRKDARRHAPLAALAAGEDWQDQRGNHGSGLGTPARTAHPAIQGVRFARLSMQSES